MKDQLSTDFVHKRARADYWREVICRSFVELDCVTAQTEDFFGSVDNSPLGKGTISRVVSTRQNVERNKSLIARSSADHFLLSLQLNGRGLIIQDGREAPLKPGELSLYDSTRQYHLKFQDPFSQLVIQIPRTLARHHLGIPERLTAVRLSHSISGVSILSNFIEALYKDSLVLSDAQKEKMFNSLLELLGAVYHASDLNITREVSTNQYTQLMLIKNYILENLPDYALCPQSIAQYFKISPRYLNKLFEHEGCSASRWIYQKRLERCCADLTDPIYSGLTISEIAFKWGFNEFSHFSRSFKEKYGASPRDYRLTH
ncbi:helix-turn-helix domain-containing protein [Emcibacter sp.]|uniref:AraC-like ligand-binding domain-containing protein n=1 Tax=Emcibacter sp. TaxID=1979954 RepID=UPI002AA818B5|nr:helix-turn-helix domain-containing protein [Emcibacter sp.]